MVKLEEVVDEEFLREQEGPHDEDDWDTDSESDTSSIADLTPDETLYERVAALQDIIPAHTRRSIASTYNTATSYLKSGLSLGGKTLWVVSTSALLLGVPWALAYSEEQMIIEQEKMELANQRAQNEFMAPSAGGQPQGAKPAL
ncbi:mitochondrial import receptor subunit Tom22 [Didymosphaeria variabile]|uniref:Mitochondrial import receptor subunit Tom22 n=1 Tax=Didymosphaeria variabile TaxID=1932322 RepID=A0A9W8XHW3_9PLEO|nr:mitochondrial import receptor subunit Tom22 [Didymosphaeria variabile]KAJ4351379.1 mitochondrial import receptor subunit Tom22 [Didymosphaeria variabile]